MANPPSRKRNWRDTAQTPKSRPIEEAWRKDQGPMRQGPSWLRSRKARRVLAFGSLLLVIGIIIAFVRLWKPVKPVHLVLIGPSYADNLFVPHNVAGRNGVNELNKLHGDKDTNWGQGDEKSDFADDFNDIKDYLDEKRHTINWFGKPRQTVIVYVSAHGVARFQGDVLKPYLIQKDYLNSATPKDPYPLDELLDLLGKLPPVTPKLLLLDVTQVSTHWPLGELYNDFARALEKTCNDRANTIENLVVISSSEKDQRSWVSPEWRQTYFTHFVLEGLKGAADRNENGRVDAKELYDYASREVQRWVSHNRNRKQTPKMYVFGAASVAEKMQLVGCKNYQANNDILDNHPESKENPEENQENGPKPGEQTAMVESRLTDAWKQCATLRKGPPYPDAYAPHWWRLYLDTLLRAEQLHRAGDDISAANMLDKVDTLYKDINDSRSPANITNSAQLTLAMPVAVGKPLDPSLVKEMRNVESGTKEPSQKLLDSLEKTLAAAKTKCRPAEVHYLMMLFRKEPSPIAPQLQDSQYWPLLQQSLTIRRLAEQAALGLREEKADTDPPAYSEQVQPWIEEIIRKADEQRRLGQDLLFFQSKHWKDATKHLGKAKDVYRDAQGRAFQVRRALEVRDRVHAELPYYTHWVAEDGAELEELVIKLWHDLHELDEQLDKPAPTVDNLVKLHEGITKNFKELTSAFRKSVGKGSGIHQGSWHHIEAALAVPFLPADERKSLIRDSDEKSGKLFLETLKKDDPGLADGSADQARATAQRQGRLALATLGDSWQPESQEIRKQVINSPPQLWEDCLTRAGAFVGSLLNRLPEEINDKCDEAVKSRSLKTADVSLRDAASRARTVAAAAFESRVKKDKDPFDLKRCLDWHHLLSVQAERTYLDWWAGLTGEKHYYQQAADLFLTDAHTLVSGKIAGSDLAGACQIDIEKQRGKLKSREVIVKVASSDASPNEFEVGPKIVNLTDEPQGVKRFYRLEGPKDIPGQPVLWVDPRSYDESGLQRVDREQERQEVQFDAPGSIRLTIKKDRQKEPMGNKDPRHIVLGFFRGHDSILESTVRMHLKPNLTLSMPQKHGGGSVAVQSKETLYKLFEPEKAAISIVLDCSGSMKDPYNEEVYRYHSDDRFHQAIRALESVLKKLPDGVTICLRAFGALEFDRAGAKEEKNRMRVWPPFALTPQRREKLIDELDGLTPHYYTPLLRAIQMASEDFPDRAFTARTVIAITDGGDSEFNDKAKDLDLKDKLKEQGEEETITGYMRYLKKDLDKSGIQLIVIGFNVKEGDLDPKEVESFKAFPEAMRSLGLVYEYAEKRSQLETKLINSLLRSYFRVEPQYKSTRKGIREVSRPITQTGDPPAWVSLPPVDFYKVRVPSINYQQNVRIEPGDVLLLDLEAGEENGRVKLQQGMYAESEFLRIDHGRTLIRSAERKEGWLLSVLQNQIVKRNNMNNKVQMLATLQSEQGNSPVRVIKQLRPQWVWFDIPEARSGNALPRLTITPVSRYPAPAWGLDLESWLPTEPVRLNAWWGDLPTPHGRSLFLSEGLPRFDYKWPINNQPGSVQLESLDIEEQEINVEEDIRDVERRPTRGTRYCVVVRLRYEIGQGPFFVHWPGWEYGQEHRFYTKAGKYTGLFWSTDDEWSTYQKILQTVRNRRDELRIYSVAELKNDKNFLHPKELDLGSPKEGWVRPDPVQTGKHSFPD